MKTRTELLQELEVLNFPVALEDVFHTCSKGDLEGYHKAYSSKAVVGYGGENYIVKNLYTLFGIVSDRYLLIENKDFFIPMLNNIGDYVEIEDIRISSNNKGSYYVEYMINQTVLGLGKIGILGINSYDGSASSQINLFVKFKQKTGETNVFLDFNFKHKHTHGNTYRNQLDILRNRASLTSKLDTLFNELNSAQLSKSEFIRICNNVKLPKIYMDAIIGSLYFTKDSASCLSVYLGISSTLDGMEIIRKISFLNNILRGIRMYKQEVSTLEF